MQDYRITGSFFAYRLDDQKPSLNLCTISFETPSALYLAILKLRVGMLSGVFNEG